MKNHHPKKNHSLSQAELCTVLDRAGVPDTAKWRGFIFYLRGITEHNHLSDSQKKAAQQILTDIFTKKDYSDVAFQKFVLEQFNSIIMPYKKIIEDLLGEASSIVKDFQGLMSNRYDDFVSMEKTAITIVETATDTSSITGQLTTVFSSVRKQLEKDLRTLESLALRDSLTDTANRKAFEDFLEKAIVQWQEKGTPLALAMFDIDHFKKFNDTHGHRIGDQAISVTARQITGFIEANLSPTSNALVARYGGEEFALVVLGDDAYSIAAMAENIRKAIANFNFIIRDTSGNVLQSGLRITVSGGAIIASPIWNGAYRDNLVDCADKALYHAKASGRNRIVLCTPDQDSPFLQIS